MRKGIVVTEKDMLPWNDAREAYFKATSKPLEKGTGAVYLCAVVKRHVEKDIPQRADPHEQEQAKAKAAAPKIAEAQAAAEREAKAKEAALAKDAEAREAQSKKEIEAAKAALKKRKS